MRPLDGVYGTGISFDTHKIGGGFNIKIPNKPRILGII